MNTTMHTSEDEVSEAILNPPMRVVVFASQKGGSGKTTLSGHVAVQAQLAGGGPVAMIDTDPQGSLHDWAKAREDEQPECHACTPGELRELLDGLRMRGIRMVVIDTPPAVTEAIDEVVQCADLVVIPTRPSPHDLRAVGATVDIVEAHRKSMVFVVNSATARARITAEAAVALSQHGTVAPATIHNRVDFAASMIDGRTVMEIDGCQRSGKEIVVLWDYLTQRLAKLPRLPHHGEDGSQRPGFVEGGDGGALRRQAGTFGRRFVAASGS